MDVSLESRRSARVEFYRGAAREAQRKTLSPVGI
jgi:hypothetical protein